MSGAHDGAVSAANELAGLANWRLARDADGLAWLSFDCAGSSTNTLSASVLGELGRAVDALLLQPPRGLVILSSKASGFAAGADIREFEHMVDPAIIAAMISDVHDLFERIEKLPFPSVARVHGFCLGGGLELALACRHIVAADDSATRLGFPEILLGIHPGFGGTVRSIRACGVLAALDLMLSGRAIDARRARGLGLIDRAVPMRHLDAAARHYACQQRPRRQAPLLARAASLPLLRGPVVQIVRRQVRKRAPEQHYPAPYALLDLWRAHGGNERALYQAEARSVAALIVSPSSRNLVRLFKLQERLKALGRGAASAVRSVHVIGAGTMGGDIAAWCALRGMQVTLQDRAPQYIAPAMARAHALFARRLRDKFERLAAHDRLSADFSGDGLRRADIVIEAIIEDTAAKCALFQQAEAQARPDALLATNTSSIPLADIAGALRDPGRLVGIHFFNPVAQMQLVEIIAGQRTRREVAERAASFTTAIDRLPLPARSAPGFLINRVLSPYLQEAMLMLEEGMALGQIDAVAREFGMPMGPLELADTVGLDICLHVGEILSAAFGGEVPRVLRHKVEQGKLGRKSGAGFYVYRKGKAQPEAAGPRTGASAEMRDRMLLRLLNEAAACLREGIVEDADMIDVGMVFGTGFAPFRGGPLHYARERGIGEVTAALTRMAAVHGPRFTPDAGWARLAGEA